ncbi:fasciclin-like arabinogalactan protein 2 [Neltuma alba]|uniref:fasciclin-like arabinogalactan protein 2 n=1 Tax=Neltuma alba TaxID=207710 RepID=UPI0010A4978A|nr:fasciclin-like arabinogalactan protein 2 [Prosopis alba]
MEKLAVASTIVVCLILSLLFSNANAAKNGGSHNITRILAKNPDFSTFNHYLSATHLADEINRRRTITVLTVDNAGMSDLLSKHFNIYTLKNVLSLHVLADYFGAKKLHQISNRTTLVSSLFQATGAASGTAGYINITDIRGGIVGFGAEDNDGSLHSFYIKSVFEIPYVISVLQISHPLSSPDAEAPTSGPGLVNLTVIMAKQGCKGFADLLRPSKALPAFEHNVDGGLTVFCPTDDAVTSFLPKYKNLTDSEKESLLLYHGVPEYETLQMLRSHNGRMNTLATEGANKFDFSVKSKGEDVMLNTKIVTSNIVGTLIDQDPVVVYKIDEFLLPRELFKEAPAMVPAESPKPAKKKKKAASPEEAHSPDSADSPDSFSDNQKAADDDNGSTGSNNGFGFITLLVTVVMGFLLL